MAKKIKPIKCKFCGKLMKDAITYGTHLENVHPDMVPEDMTGVQFYHYMKTGRTSGTCPMCKSDTAWNKITNKYNRFCDNPKCIEDYKKIFRDRMMAKYGKITLLNEPEQQKIMLANRKISGRYMWSDRSKEIPYTGSYELSLLEFLDHVMQFESSDIIAPSPHVYYYVYDKKKRFYIPDIFIPSLGLEIEVKDGGNNPNKHHKIQDVDKEKERLKDEVMRTNTFNYLKIVNKENERFLDYLDLAAYNFHENITKKIYMP